MNLYTYGDSVLDCSRYTGGVTPGQILADRFGWTLHHRAVDGATIYDLPKQLVEMTKPSISMLSIGGNDLLISAGAVDIGAFVDNLAEFEANLPGEVFIANIYDPAFGSNVHPLAGNDPEMGTFMRRRWAEMNNAIAFVAGPRLVDLAAHFANGSPDWFVSHIEPSATGAQEIANVYAGVIETLLS